MNEILKQILNEVKGIKNDLSDVKNDLSDVKNDLSGVKSELSDVKHDVKDVKQGQERIESKVDNVILEMRSNFKHNNEKLDEHRKVFEVISGEIKGVKVDVDYLSSKKGKQDMELTNVKNILKG